METLGASVDLNPPTDECCCCCCCCWATPRLSVWAKSAAAVELLLPTGKKTDDVLVNVVNADVKPTDELVLPYRDGLIDWPADPLAPL